MGVIPGGRVGIGLEKGPDPGEEPRILAAPAAEVPDRPSHARRLLLDANEAQPRLEALQEAELVTCRPEGTRRWYRARPEGAAELRAWLDDFWATGLERLKRNVESEEQR